MEIVEYDLEDNYLRTFKDYKEAATMLKTTKKILQSAICRIKSGKQKYYRDKVWKKDVRLYMVNVKESEHIIFGDEL